MCINCGFTDALGALMTDRFREDIGRGCFLQNSLACVGVASSFSLSSVAFAAPTETDRASVIFRNGKVYTLDARKPWAQAVAVAGDKIIAVGSNAEVLALDGPGTKVIDLAGRMLMPGFVESHIHPFVGAFMTSGVDLQLPTGADALAAIASYAKAHPTGPVRGFGWRVDMFPPEGPTREMLDSALPDRPAFFFAIDAHSLWVNSNALEIAGIDAHTPDPIPDFSYFVRDKTGKPTGYILETSAILEVVNAVEPISLDTMARMLVDWLPKASAAGITSVYDAGVPPIGADQGAILAIYTELERQGRLPFRVVASYLLKGPPVDAATTSTQDLMRRIDTDLVQARSPEDPRRRNAGGLHRMASRALCGQAGFDWDLALQRGSVEEHDRRGGPRGDRRACPRLRRTHGPRCARRLRGGDRNQSAARQASRDRP